MNRNPKYDNDLVTLGDLKKYLNESGEETQEYINNLPKSYSSPPVPPYYVGAILYYNHYVYRCKTERIQGSFNLSDWEIVASDDNSLSEWINDTYTPDQASLQAQIDGKIETYYQSSDPNTWTTDIEKAKHVGDFWYNTSNDTQWRYCRYETNPVTYGWAQVDVPQSIYDSINSKKSIYTTKPTSYKANDLWIIENNILDEDIPVGEEENPIVRGDWVFAIQDSNSYDKTHWVKKDTYSIDINNIDLKLNGEVTSINNKLDDYVSKSSFAPFENKINHFEEDYYTKDEVIQKLTDGSVTKVNTLSATLDINGMTYERPGEPTKTTINNVGITTKDANTDEIILFAGYVESGNPKYSDFEGQTIVAAENIRVDNYFIIGSHSRFEDYETGTGCFYIG